MKVELCELIFDMFYLEVLGFVTFLAGVVPSEVRVFGNGRSTDWKISHCHAIA